MSLLESGEQRYIKLLKAINDNNLGVSDIFMILKTSLISDHCDPVWKRKKKEEKVEEMHV